VQEYCRVAGLAFTRCRPYRKNDQAWAEQKNGSVVRRIVGYRRFEGLEAAATLAHLYARMKREQAPNAHGAAARRRWAAAVAVLTSLQNGERAWLDNPDLLQSPVDLPLRLDDAGASSTTPQGPQQQVTGIKKGKRDSGER
jgi:hypothetical protein